MRNIFLILLTLHVGLLANKLNIDDKFYIDYVQNSKLKKTILVKDTDSPLGRYNLESKELSLKSLFRAHGHLCDGLLIAYIELSNTLPLLFEDGVVDRTDLRVVAKNSPCLVDTSSLMSGARLNHKTLSLDNKLDASFIVQKISTGEAYKVELADKTFLKELKAKEKFIKTANKKGESVSAKDIDEVEVLAFDVMKYLVKQDAKELLKITKLQGYKFEFDIKDFGKRSDIVNKDVPRIK